METEILLLKRKLFFNEVEETDNPIQRNVIYEQVGGKRRIELEFKLIDMTGLCLHNTYHMQIFIGQASHHQRKAPGDRRCCRTVRSPSGANSVR